MSKRIPARLKAELGEYLAEWYRHFGKVAQRRAYHEDDEATGGAATTNNPFLFENHPFLVDTPLGAPSDLSSIVTADQRTIDEADKRDNELTLALKNKLELQLGAKKKKEFLYEQLIKPKPF